MEAKQIITLLARLGICPAYKGYPYLVHIIGLTANNSRNFFPPLKELYLETAKKFEVSPSIVEHDIRTLIRGYWNQNNASRFSSIIGYPVYDRLTIKEFISVVAEYIGVQDSVQEKV